MKLKSLYFNLAYVFFLFGAKNRVYKQNTYTKYSWKLSISILHDHNKPLSPFYLEEMKHYWSVCVPRAVCQVIMRVHKPAVAYKLALQ